MPHTEASDTGQSSIVPNEDYTEQINLEPYEVREVLPSELYSSPFLVGQSNDMLYSSTAQYREFTNLIKLAEVENNTKCKSIKNLPVVTLDTLNQSFKDLDVGVSFLGRCSYPCLHIFR